MQTKTVNTSVKKTSKGKSAQPRICFDRAGLAYYRTRLIKDKTRAVSFARCIAANPRYQDAEIMTSDQGRGWFVRYRPTNKERIEALSAIKQTERYQRALFEKDYWRIRPDWSAEKADRWLVKTHVGDEKREREYLVSDDHCTCDDFGTRCKDAGIMCKHQIGVFLLIGEGKLLRKTDVPKRQREGDRS